MAESYENLLYDLQKNNKTPLITHLLPKDNQIHVIDMNTRTIDVPQFLSVRFDHNAEVIYFKCARYFEGVDLAVIEKYKPNIQQFKSKDDLQKFAENKINEMQVINHG